jgi:hypothetical protein
MKIAIERGNWKALRTTIAMGSSHKGVMKHLVGDPVGLRGMPFLRLCMDAPQVRLAGLGVFRFPAVDIAVRVALAIVWSTFHGWRNTTMDFLFHMVNFTFNGWTYGLICELATLPVYGQGLLLAGRILFWALLMRCIDAVFSAFVPDRYEIKKSSRKTDRWKESYGIDEKPLAHTQHTALQQSMRPVAGLVFAFLVFRPVFPSMISQGLPVKIPTADFIVSMASAMAWTFMYRLISYSIHRSPSIERNGIVHEGDDSRPDRTETRLLWARTIIVPDRDAASWFFWAPLWIGLVALVTAGMENQKAIVTGYSIGVALVPGLYFLWAVFFEWADGKCDAFHLRPLHKSRKSPR